MKKSLAMMALALALAACVGTGVTSADNDTHSRIVFYVT